MELDSARISAWIGTYFWPLLRISAMLLASPVFGARQILPMRVRVGLAVAITWALAPMLEPAPAVEVLSADGLAIAVQQLLLGVAMGFILQLAFAMLAMGGQAVSMTTGLGFATFLDPVNGIQVPVVSQLYTILGTLVFLAINGHLMVIQVLAESFETMPVQALGPSAQALVAIALWGGKLFVGALIIGLPAIVALTLINLAFGVMSRAAPQLNIFAVGFPATMAASFLVMMLTVPALGPRFTAFVMDGFDAIHGLIGG